ncbi:MAG: M14 family metallopeptidase [Candidatus Aminicenantales bacterium]
MKTIREARSKMKRTGTILTMMMLGAVLLALASPAAFGQNASDPPFKVKLDFDRWHDVPELYADFQKLQDAFPKFVKFQSIGKSYEGRDLMVLTINNPETGPEMSKAAMYIEANVHGNEIQGAEVCLYTVWYLMENYGRLDNVTKLVNERVFYIIPTVNPDGRQYFMEAPSGVNTRSGHVPVDDDGDRLVDEDKPDDLNGNGIIEQIRKYVPGKGNYRISRTNPNMMEPVPFGETGDYILLGREGIDNDGDGFVDEDGFGDYDPNRNWASDWQPDYIQRGAMQYPFQLPEAKAVNDFLLAHPNVAGVQSYHNNGGMILRGPGAEAAGEYPMSDARFYDELGQNGERILPFYRYLVIWSGLYTVHGGFIDWTNDGLGIISFSNELWNGDQYFTSPNLKEQQNNPQSPIAPNVSRYYFDKYLEFGQEYQPWKKFTHPQFGEVEIGGAWRKFQGRVPPRFMSEELCHRNMAFSLYQADEMPMVKMGEASVEKVGGDVYKVFVDITNPKVAPTIMARAAQNNVVRPDLLTLEGGNVQVIAASFIDNKELYKIKPSVTQLVDQKDLKRILVRNGQAGKTTRTVLYLVKGSGAVTVTYDSVKAGQASKTIQLY